MNITRWTYVIMPRTIETVIYKYTPNKTADQRIDWDPKNKKRKRDSKFITSRLLDLTEVTLIVRWLAAGMDYTKKGKLKQKKTELIQRDLCLFWFIMSTGFRISEVRQT